MTVEAARARRRDKMIVEVHPVPAVAWRAIRGPLWAASRTSRSDMQMHVRPADDAHACVDASSSGINLERAA